MRAVFRVDASRTIGGGHITRSLTLAAALRARGAETLFITRAFAHGAAAQIAAHGHAVIELPVQPGFADSWLGADAAADARATQAALSAAPRTDVLVVDQYALGADWERTLRANAETLLVIDDLADRDHCCDVLLDTTPVAAGAPSRYAARVLPGTQVLEGPQWALLRPEFASAQRRVRDDLRRVVVFLGTADTADVTSLALDALADPALAEIAVDVVVGDSNPHRETVLARASDRVHVRFAVTNMAELLASADCAIGAGGTASWERLRVGLPALIVQLAANQREVARTLDAAGAIRDLGTVDATTGRRMRDALAALAMDARPLAAMSAAALALSGDGPLGTDRLADVLTARHAQRAARA